MDDLLVQANLQISVIRGKQFGKFVYPRAQLPQGEIESAAQGRAMFGS